MVKESTITLHSGNKMPIFGLGTWQLTNNTAETIEYALKVGYRMIDTSSDYGTQPGIGKGIKNSNINRKNLYIITKVEETDDDSYERTESNLKELGLKYVDLMLIHRPPPTGAGVCLWEGLIQAKEEGLAKNIGVSNYPIKLIEELIYATNETPSVNQIEWSPFGYSKDMLKYCAEKNIIIQAYSPLTRTKCLNDEALNRIAKKYNKTPAQILIRWNLQLGTVPLPKANQQKHLGENIDVFDFEIDSKDMRTLSNLNEKHSSLGSLSYM